MRNIIKDLEKILMKQKEGPSFEFNLRHNIQDIVL